MLYELSNRVEDNSELFVVLAFKLVQPARKFDIGCEHFSQLTNARMISMLTNTARSLFSTLDSIATPVP